MKMTRSEEAILEWFKDRQGQDIKLETIADHLYGVVLKRERPPYWRAITLAIMRDVCMKSAYVSDLTVLRRSPRGRGRRATYYARKSFT